MKKSTLVKAGATVLAASAALTIAAASSASAAPADAGHNAYTLTNDTPYTWTLQDYSWDGYDKQWYPYMDPPVQTLQPGQSETVATLVNYNSGVYSDSTMADYSFTDINGGAHGFTINTPGNANHNDWSAGIAFGTVDTVNGKVTPAGGYSKFTNNGGDPTNLHVGLVKKDEVTIDAKADPVRASSVMKLFSSGTDQSFKQTADPKWVAVGDSQRQKISGLVINKTENEVDATLTKGFETSQSTSLGAEIGVGAELNLFDLVKADTTVSAETEGTFGQTYDQQTGVGMAVGPDGTDSSLGWITRQTQDVALTGDFSFTTPNAIYHVENVTINAQAIANAGSPQTAVTHYDEYFPGQH